MKSTVLVLFVIFHMNSAVMETVETWGNIYNVRALGFQTAKACPIFLIVQNRILTFPLVMIHNIFEIK